MQRFTFLISAVLVWIFALPASANDDLKTRRINKSRVKRRDSVTALKNHKVRVAGKNGVRVEDLSKKALARHRAMVRHMKKARRGLQGDPVVAEEVIETADATVIVATMSATVADAAVVETEVPELSAAKQSRRPKFRANQLSGQALDNFKALKKRLRKKPKRHPLRRAMKQGDDALLEALARGEGDIEVVTTVAIPKDVPEIRDGRLQLPQATAWGGFDYGGMAAFMLANGVYPSIPIGLLTALADEEQELPQTTTSGTAKLTHKTILGHTITGGWEWETKWKFAIAEVRMSAGLSYGVGLRAPVKIETKVSPKKIDTVGPQDVSEKYETEVTAKVFNAPETFYRDAGLANGDLVGGKEFVLYGQLYFNVDGKVDLYLTEPSISFGRTFGIDYSKHFQPPFGDCSDCGLDFFIPAELTNTSVSAGVVRGDLELGFKVGGKGTLSFDYESYVDDKRVKSKHGGEEKWKHRFEYKKERTRTAKTWPKVLKKQKSIKYGYRLADFKYKWDVSITPGLQGGIAVDLGVWDHTFNLGPYWFDVFEIDVGTVKLERHEGAKNIFKRTKRGTKTWSKN
jgi:hypothetical protein